jgi:hypothetical protein
MYILNCIFLLLRCSVVPGKNMKDVWKSRWKESDIGSPFLFHVDTIYSVYTYTPFCLLWAVIKNFWVTI